MDKTYQDIHYVNFDHEEVFVMRQVRINEIQMHETYIEIFISTINMFTEKPDNRLAVVIIPKLRNHKLIID